ncbi:hypothetical protein [Fluviicola sp.]|uniref:hypothetical protein n=1 Tax=Fluviicola sp. TaxID=1917219 RepID=UPI003D275E8C
MFENTKPRIGQELLDVPMGDMIHKMAFAIAEAQVVLDQNSIEVAEMMGGLRTITDDAGNVTFEDSRIFLGTDKISKAAAVELHNSTNNIQQKAEIRAMLNGSFKPELDADFEPGDVLTVDKYAQANGVIYIYGTSGNVEVEPRNFTITLNDGVAGIVSLPRRISMLECGFTPTFYQFVDTIIEVKISIKYTQEGTYNTSSSSGNTSAPRRIGLAFLRGRSGRSIQTAQVNASYSQKYSYSSEGSSLLRTKMAVVPPPSALQDRIERMLEAEFDNATVPPAATPPQTQEG